MTPPGNLGRPSRPGDAKTYRAIGLALVFVVIAAIVFVFVRTLVFDRPLNDRALQQALVAASVGVTVVCLIAWLLDLLKILELRAGWGRFLWSVLIASVLGNSALIYKRFATGAEAISVACLRPLVTVAENVPHALRGNTIYRRSDSFAFFISLRNLQKDQNGEYAIDFRYALEDRQNNRSQFLEHHFSGNAEKLKSDPQRRKRLNEYRAIAPECVDGDTVQSAQAMTFAIKDIGSGTHALRVSVYDRVSSTFALADLAVQIVD